MTVALDSSALLALGIDGAARAIDDRVRVQAGQVGHQFGVGRDGGVQAAVEVEDGPHPAAAPGE